MKKIFVPVIAVILCAPQLLFAQGKFSATVTNSGNVITFKLKPNVTTVTAFSTIEFFLRYPSGTPAFNYGAVTVNSANFPGMTPSGSPGSWEIERNNPAYLVPGYSVDHFIYTGPAPASTLRSYTGGTEYDLISVSISGSSSAGVDFQFIHQNTEAYYYLAITGELGNDLRPSSFSNYFYPATLTVAGPAGSTYYYMERNDIALPIKLSSFNAAVSACNINLAWQSTEEHDFAYYAIERSVNAIVYHEIGRVNTSENKASVKSYNFIDNNSPEGTIFYRLRFVDNNGKYAYSTVKQVSLGCHGKNDVIVYPTPSNGIVNVKLPTGFENAKVRIINSIGEEVVSNENKSLFRTINLRKTAAGAYLVQVINNSRITDTIKFILQE